MKVRVSIYEHDFVLNVFSGKENENIDISFSMRINKFEVKNPESIWNYFYKIFESINSDKKLVKYFGGNIELQEFEEDDCVAIEVEDQFWDLYPCNFVLAPNKNNVYYEEAFSLLIKWMIGRGGGVDNDESITHPLLNPNSKHYDQPDGREGIELLESIFTTDQLKSWALITAMKYRLRIGRKDDGEKELLKIKTYEDYYKYLSEKEEK